MRWSASFGLATDRAPADDLRVDLRGAAIRNNAKPNGGCRQSRELVFEPANAGAVGINSD